jgi:hypothetical protein
MLWTLPDPALAPDFALTSFQPWLLKPRLSSESAYLWLLELLTFVPTHRHAFSLKPTPLSKGSVFVRFPVIDANQTGPEKAPPTIGPTLLLCMDGKRSKLIAVKTKKKSGHTK